MASIINADDGVISGAAGIKLSADTSGDLNIQTNGVTAISVSASQVVSFPATTGFSIASATVTNLVATSLTVSSGSTLNGGVVINELGADADTRIEGDTDANLFFVDASTDRIGVGTNAPTEKFEVKSGNSAVTFVIDTTNAAGTRMEFKRSGTTYTYFGDAGSIIGSGATGGTALFTVGANPLLLGVNGSTAATLDSSGNLGLGVTPQTINNLGGYKAFEVASGGFTLYSGTNQSLLSTNAKFDGSTAKYSVSNFATYYNQQSGVHSWATAPSGTAGNAITFTQAMTLEATGCLAIGNTGGIGSAADKVVSVEGTNSGQVQLRYNGTEGAYLYSNSSNTVLSSVQNLPLLFNTNNTERARIKSNGYSMFSNDGTYANSTYHEFSQGGGNWILHLRNTSSTGMLGVPIVYSNAAPNNTANEFLYCVDSSLARAVIRSNGGFANYQANDVNLSDERVKTDIKPLGSMWDKFKAIEIVTFKYKDQTHDDNNIGVIAQQVESVAPEFIDTDGFGETPEDGVPLKTVYTTDLYHAAIKALQEAMTRIEELEAKVAALEAK